MDAIMQAYLDTGLRATVVAQFTDIDYFSLIPLWLIDEVAPGAATSAGARGARPGACVRRNKWQGRSSRAVPVPRAVVAAVVLDGAVRRVG